MPTYKPDVKIYYGSISPENRLIPAPDISISVQNSYSNDTIIGYVYAFSLSGFATSLDLRELDYGDSYDNEISDHGLGNVVDHIHKVRKILAQNGNNFIVVDGQTNTPILTARGGILRSLSFDESNNNWTKFSPYNATLEFNSVDFMTSTDSCGSSFLDPSGFPEGKAGIVDINQFKIKSFNDSWSFNFEEGEAYQRIKNIETGTNLNINNTSFSIQYTINAVGKHFANNGTLIPAWEQAKNFVQYRLHSQVTNLLDNILKNPYETCGSSDGLDNINIPGSSSDGLLSSLGNSLYKIYNETITCESSESDGSFSATYNATVCPTAGASCDSCGIISNLMWSSPGATHTITKSVKTSKEQSTGKVSRSISINGTIQGMIEGGLIRTPKVMQLPSKGAITIFNSITATKYDNAKAVLDKIYSSSDYNGGIGSQGKRDLKPAFKNALGINMDMLYEGVSRPVQHQNPCPGDQNSSIPDPPHASSFNLTHDYNNGTITYSLEYSTDNNNCGQQSGQKYSQISIQTTQPTKVIATFNVPNSESCTIIQELGTYTAKKVSITIAGTDNSCKGKPKEIDLGSIIECGSCSSDEYLPISMPPEGSYILTQKQYTKNPIDGSFTVNIAYTCAAGCDI